MQGKLQRRYEIQKEVTRGGSFEGSIKLSELARLTEFLYSDRANVAIEFEFIRRNYEAVMLKGKLKTCLSVECQRCLQAVERPVLIDFSLLVDATDEQLTESSLDTIYSEEGYIDIFEVVEDELILGLPLVNMHDDIACNEYWPVKEQDPEQVSENPFSVLKKLKTN